MRHLAASVALACGALLAQSAHALALGRVNVQSALGEPLQAEIEVPDINSEEAASLRAAVASPDAFKRAGLEYNNMLSGLQVSLQRRADGRSFLRLTGDRAINEPYLDLILEATWAAGRISRDYTMLFDPPVNRQPQQPPPPVAPTAPVVTAEPEPSAARPPPTPAPLATPVSPVAAARARPVAPVAVAAPARPVAAPAPAPAPAPVATEGKRVNVRAGDTATKIANAVKPRNISLDQMLVALLRSNPDAFIAGNVNRLKAGSILDVPSEDQANTTGKEQATQEVLAQSRDFDEFRRKLASGAPMVASDASKRALAGKLQTQVEDKKPSSTAADKLSLQKAALAAQEEKLANELAAKEAARRQAEIDKNIADLKKMAAASAAAAAAPASPPVAVKSSAPVAPIVVTAPAPLPEPVASQPEPVASSPAPEVSAPVVAAPVLPVAKPAPPPPVEEPSLVSELMDNPLVPAAAGGLVALLGGLAFYRVRQRKKAGQVDSSFMESRLQPDSFFGASGGQKVDTNEGDGSNSSLAYSPSQLDAAGDVDPVAEADVYLAYGRDLQAEEILKEAVRTNPTRAAIHFKLLQIYAKRRDIKAYIAVAHDAHKLTRGLGPEWAQASEVGHELDPTCPLFMPGADADAVLGATTPLPLNEHQDSVPGSFDATNAFNPSSLPGTPDANELDLDFSSRHDDEDAEQDALAPVPELSLPPVDQNVPLEFDIPLEPEPEQGLDFESQDAMAFGEALAAPAAPEARNSQAGPLEFDLGGLSLDLPTPAPKPEPVPEPVSAPSPLDSVFQHSTGPDSRGSDVSADDALATKLALAEEFQAIGDDDGARTLAQEVVDAATGNLKAKAQRFLAELG